MEGSTGVRMLGMNGYPRAMEEEEALLASIYSVNLFPGLG